MNEKGRELYGWWRHFFIYSGLGYCNVMVVYPPLKEPTESRMKKIHVVIIDGTLSVMVQIPG